MPADAATDPDPMLDVDPVIELDPVIDLDPVIGCSAETHRLREGALGRLILAALLAPVFWGILLVPGNLLLMQLFPDALTTQPPPLPYLITALLASFGYGIFAGFCSAWTAGDRARQAGVWAGLVLLAVGVAVQTASWDLLPVWWHLCFLIAIIPMAIIGARLHSARSG